MCKACISQKGFFEYLLITIDSNDKRPDIWFFYFLLQFLEFIDF